MERVITKGSPKKRKRMKRRNADREVLRWGIDNQEAEEEGEKRKVNRYIDRNEGQKKKERIP